MTELNPRSPALAALLSAVVWPGLGQLYNGRLVRFLLAQVAVPVGYTVALLAVLRVGPTVRLVAAVHLLAMLAWLAVAWEAHRDAKRARTARPWYSGPLALVAVGVVTTCVLLPVWTVVAMKTATPTYKIPTGSMEPTLLRGDHLLANAAAYGFRLPFHVTPSIWRRPAARGDLAVFRFPPNPAQHFVQRVVGLPGETVEIRGRTVYVDGHALEEPYVQFIGEPDADSWLRAWGPETIPAGHYWMLGDNRDNSKDSRFWGFLPESELIARIGVVYVSIEPSRLEGQPGRLRRERFGLVPR
jgi:signal peptidase I